MWHKFVTLIQRVEDFWSYFFSLYLLAMREVWDEYLVSKPHMNFFYWIIETVTTVLILLATVITSNSVKGPG